MRKVGEELFLKFLMKKFNIEKDKLDVLDAFRMGRLIEMCSWLPKVAEDIAELALRLKERGLLTLPIIKADLETIAIYLRTALKELEDLAEKAGAKFGVELNKTRIEKAISMLEEAIGLP